MSLGAIALDPTRNAHGDYNLMSLATGAHISRNKWTSLHMTDTAISRVHALELQDGQPLIQEHGFVVEWHPDHHIDDSEYDLGLCSQVISWSTVSMNFKEAMDNPQSGKIPLPAHSTNTTSACQHN